MGCVSSRPEFPNDVHPNLFTVTTISRPNSTLGNEQDSSSSSKDNVSGHLEVASNEIILHRRGHDPVHWPLQYIRRYGYENHLFSFESGRRCESGPGIFTFRCRRARELFLMVQSNVQEARDPLPGATNNNRVRLDSTNSQLASPGPVDTGNGSVRTHSNDYLTSERPSILCVTNGTVHPSSPGRGSVAIDAFTSDDIDGGQVFEEITPLRSGVESQQRVLSVEERRQRLSSHTSSAASERSISGSMAQSRPISFKFLLSPTSSPQDDLSINPFVSPQHSNPSPSASPPTFVHYVNIDPPSQNIDRPRKIDSQRHLSADRYSNGSWKPPARSHSLGSPNAPEVHRYLGLCSNVGAYVNITTYSREPSPSPSPSPVSRPGSQHGHNGVISAKMDNQDITLDYVTLDVGNGGSGFTVQRSPRRQYSNTSSDTYYPPGRGLAFASSLTSVRESEQLKNDEGTNEGTSNYASIDCTRTKALRETAAAAHIQRQSTSCSASSSEMTIIANDQTGRRSRHDSARK